MIDIISVLVSVSVALFDFARNNKIDNEAHRNSIADFFKKISETLDVVADELSANLVPHGACANIREYALKLPEIVDGVMPAEQAKELSDMLLQAHNVEMLIIETQDKLLVERIRFASWRLDAASTLIRII